MENNEILMEQTEELNVDELVENCLEENKVDTALTDEVAAGNGETFMTTGQLALAVAGIGLVAGGAYYAGKWAIGKAINLGKKAVDKIKDKRAAKKAAKENKAEIVTLNEDGEEQ